MDFSNQTRVQNRSDEIQHAFPVATGEEPFICLLEGPVVYLEVNFKDDISARGMLDIGKPRRSNQFVQELVINLGITGHELQSLLNSIRLKIPEFRTSNEVENTIIFWGKVHQDGETRQAVGVLLDSACAVKDGNILALKLEGPLKKLPVGSFICWSYLKDKCSLTMMKWVPYRKGRK